MQCSVSWKGATFSHIGLGARRRLRLRAAGYTYNMAHERTARHGLYQRVSAQRLLYITQYRYACTHMCRGACVHPPSRLGPYARSQVLKSMQTKGAWQPHANRACAQVWAGQVQEGARHARTMDTHGHGARMQ